MALQHFYSRVPFRASMFNKADGFDTFACSAGLSEEFIGRELAAVCERKPNPREAAQIRLNALPPVYCSYPARTGELVQSRTTYIPSDYTGERPSYLVHTLVCSEAEKASLLHSPDHALLNPGLFEGDISAFRIDAPSAAPIRDYPEREATAVEAGRPERLADAYDEKLLRYLIFSLLDCVCGKTRSVYFTLPGEQTPEDVVGFFCTVVQILPYHIRERLSFVSAVSDTAALPAFKVKYAPSLDEEVPPQKGVRLRFDAGSATGIRENAFAEWKDAVEFLYDLLRKDAVRREFLAFAERAVGRVSAAGALTPSAVNSLVFLFRCGSGFYEEREVMPHDAAVLSFLTVYGKMRQALSDEYRMNSIRCLRRYAEEAREIPGKIFSRMSQLYALEPPCTRRIISGVVLDLIHTDVMRGKLFTFLKNRFDGEEAETREAVVEHLMRVFYGGFLQPQILAMLAPRFETMSDASKTAIVAKISVSLRTRNVQGPILDFLESGYDAMTPENRAVVYAAIPAYLGEGDELARRLIGFVNGRAEGEPEEVRRKFLRKFLQIITAEQRRTSHPLLRICAGQGGFCGRAILEKVVVSRSRQRIFREYLSLVAERSLTDLIRDLLRLLRTAPRIPAEAVQKAISLLEKLLGGEKPRCDAFELAEILVLLSGVPADDPAAAFARETVERAAIPALCLALPGVFGRTDLPDAVERIAESVGDAAGVRDSAQFALLRAYLLLKQRALDGDADGFLDAYARLSADEGAGPAVGTYMYRDLIGSERAPEEPMRTVVTVCSHRLSGEGFSFVGLLDSLTDERKDQAGEEPGKAPPRGKAALRKAQAEARAEAFRTVLRIGLTLFSSDAEGVREIVTGEGSDFLEAVRLCERENRKVAARVIRESADPSTSSGAAYARFLALPAPGGSGGREGKRRTRAPRGREPSDQAPDAPKGPSVSRFAWKRKGDAKTEEPGA